MDEQLKTFTAFWLDGKREVLQGNDPADAFRCAGYGRGAIRALDFWGYGDNQDYAWDIEKRKWIKLDTTYKVF